jgi:protein-disulfide isomerase
MREIIGIVPAAIKPLRSLIFALTLTGLGCHAQVPAGDKLSPELARRIEILIRQRSNVSPEYTILVGTKTKSNVPGYEQVDVTFSDGEKSSKPVPFLISADGKTLAQFSTYDISQDPKTKVSEAGRPARGGPEHAPVTIVEFDDLECPYCSKMHAQLFPALLDRYKNQVRIVYRDFPLSQHPWAMRAAVDSNCLAEESGTGYWNMVDYVHLHADELGGDQKSLTKANDALDTITLDEGKRQKVDVAKLAACVKKQDESPVKDSMKVAEGLGVSATPALFINGEKLEGAVPMEWVYRMIDSALTAEGVTPPPPPAPATTNPAATATKSGNGQ